MCLSRSNVVGTPSSPSPIVASRMDYRQQGKREAVVRAGEERKPSGRAGEERVHRKAADTDRQPYWSRALEIPQRRIEGTQNGDG